MLYVKEMFANLEYILYDIRNILNEILTLNIENFF